jgi:hypothetical protein
MFHLRTFITHGRSKTIQPSARSKVQSPRRRLRLELLEDRTLLSTVVNLDDSGAGSLRQAIEDANANPGADMIDFAPSLNGTIALTSGELTITDDLTIDGPGADKLTVSGNNASRVFNIPVSGIDVAIDELTIAHGLANEGAGILNLGADLTLSHVIVSDNRAIGLPGVGVTDLFESDGQAAGGGVRHLRGGVLTVIGSVFTDNEAIGAIGGGHATGGGIHNLNSSLVVSDSAFVHNVAVGGNGTSPQTSMPLPPCWLGA